MELASVPFAWRPRMLELLPAIPTWTQRLKGHGSWQQVVARARHVGPLDRRDRRSLLPQLV